MNHYGALHRAGDVPPLPDREALFWSHVDRRGPGECWEWQAFTNERGYGQGRTSDGGYMAHRRAWELTNGPVPEGLFVCHHCDNPPCCNPAHLFVGTNADNVHDMLKKGRGSRATARLTDDQALRAYVLVMSGRRTGKEVAAWLGVSPNTISRIMRRKTYRSVTAAMEDT